MTYTEPRAKMLQKTEKITVTFLKVTWPSVQPSEIRDEVAQRHRVCLPLNQDISLCIYVVLLKQRGRGSHRGSHPPSP